MVVVGLFGFGRVEADRLGVGRLTVVVQVGNLVVDEFAMVVVRVDWLQRSFAFASCCCGSGV